MRALLQRVSRARVRVGDETTGEIEGGLLVFVCAMPGDDTARGTRPGFSRAAPPDLAEQLYDAFVTDLRSRHDRVETGRFGADMAVELVNDGPVTIWLDTQLS